MAGIKDGLGFEEVNQSGLNTAIIQAGSIINRDGELNSDRTQGGFGARIETGSSLTGATGIGSAVFQTNFKNAQYYFNATAGSLGGALAVNAGSSVAMINGLTKTISGLAFAGEASTPYYWIAVGL